MLALREQCRHPSTGLPYVRFGIGGRENSPEGLSVCFFPFLTGGMGNVNVV